MNHNMERNFDKLKNRFESQRKEIEKAEEVFKGKKFNSEVEKQLALFALKQAKLDISFSSVIAEIGSTLEEITEYNKGVSKILDKLIDEKDQPIDVSSIKHELEEIKKHRPNLDWLARRLEEEGKTSSD